MRTIKTVETTCECCGKVFTTTPSRLKHGRGKNCSMECSYKSRANNQKTRDTRHCARCGKEFEATPSKIEKGRGIYCSRECQYPPVVATCKYCGKEFRYSPSAQRQFCSKDCTDKSEEKSNQARHSTIAAWEKPETRTKIMEGIKRRSESEEWKNAAHFQRGEAHPRFRGNKRGRLTEIGRYAYRKWHKAVLKQCNYTCQECGERGTRLEAHHVKPWADHVELRYDPSNGIALCEDCHIKIHNYYRNPVFKVCSYCGESFRPSKMKQKFCHRQCYLDSLKKITKGDS